MGRLIYLIGQGFENVWKNKLMFFASVLIISTTMITLGIFTIIGENANAVVKSMTEEQAMVVYVKEGLTNEQIDEVERNIKSVGGIINIVKETKEEALQKAISQYFDETNIDLTIGWENSNIFTDSFAIRIEDLNNASNIAVELRKIENVRKVVFADEIFSTVTKLTSTVNTVVMVVFILLVGVSILVISNTIKLVLHSRRKEIHIMKYIGATDNFVKTPFVIEGVIVGLTGAIISWFITIKAYGAFQDSIVKSFGMSASTFNPVYLDDKILKMNIAIGLVVSIVACLISIKKYLKV